MIKRKPIVLFFLLFMCFNVHANAGVPMIAVIFPKTVLSLIPIILIETAVLAKTLKLNKKKTVSAVVAGNACSTLFGIPITWAILAYIQISTGGDGSIDGVGDLMKKILRLRGRHRGLCRLIICIGRFRLQHYFCLYPFSLLHG